jgi:hypothetical protein
MVQFDHANKQDTPSSDGSIARNQPEPANSRGNFNRLRRLQSPGNLFVDTVKALSVLQCQDIYINGERIARDYLNLNALLHSGNLSTETKRQKLTPRTAD